MKKYKKLIVCSVLTITVILVILFLIPIYNNNKIGVITNVEYVYPGTTLNPRIRIQLDNNTVITYVVSAHRFINGSIYFNSDPVKSHVGDRVRLTYSTNIYGMNYFLFDIRYLPEE